MGDSHQTAWGGDIPEPVGPPPLVPLRLRDVDVEKLGSTPIYLGRPGPDGGEEFHLYRAPDVPFTANHRRRLLDGGVETIYVPGPSGRDGQRRPAAPSDPLGNRRQHPREQLWCPARLVVHEGPHGDLSNLARVLGAQVFDISRGLGVLCKRPLERGWIVMVHLEAPGWERRSLRSRVARCQRRPAWCEVGLVLF